MKQGMMCTVLILATVRGGHVRSCITWGGSAAFIRSITVDGATVVFGTLPDETTMRFSGRAYRVDREKGTLTFEGAASIEILHKGSSAITITGEHAVIEFVAKMGPSRNHLLAVDTPELHWVLIDAKGACPDHS